MPPPNIIHQAKKHSIELISFDKTENLQYCGICKLTLVRAPKPTVALGNTDLIFERFIFPLTKSLVKNDESTLRMRKIFTNWIKKLEIGMKNGCIEILKNNNVYELLFPAERENIIINVRKRRFNNSKNYANSDVSDNKNGSADCYNEIDDSSFAIKTSSELPSTFCLPSTKNQKTSTTIIESSNYEIISFERKGVPRSRLFVFADVEKQLCYDYFWDASFKRYICYGCRKKNSQIKKNVAARIYKMKNGKEYVKLNGMEHICTPQNYNPNKYTYDTSKKKIMNATDFKILEFTQNNVTKKRLFICAASNKSLGYEYYWLAKTGYYHCCGCNNIYNSVRALLCKNSQGQEYLKLTTAEHVCELRQFQPNKYKNDIIIKKSNYQLFEHKEFGNDRKCLAVFTNEHRKFYHKFLYCNTNGFYYCIKCHSKKCSIRAKIFADKNGEKFFSLADKEHICQPVEYLPSSLNAQKIIKKPNFKILKQRTRGKYTDKLIVLLENDKSLCYEYAWRKAQKEFICNICSRLHNTHVFGKLVKKEDGNEEEYIELGRNEHKCQPIKFIKENYGMKIIEKALFEYYEYKTSNGKDRKKLAIFLNENDKTLHYHLFIYLFVCI